MSIFENDLRLAIKLGSMDAQQVLRTVGIFARLLKRRDVKPAECADIVWCALGGVVTEHQLRTIINEVYAS